MAAESYAVIRCGGKQYCVSPGDRVVVDSIEGEVGSEVTIDDVLLLGTGAKGTEGDKVVVGTPRVDGASVTANIVKHDKAKKVVVFKRKRRKGYKCKTGHRQHVTVLEISAING